MTLEKIYLVVKYKELESQALRDNDILIFDEVTSSLDEKTGKEIIENIKALRNKLL